MIAMSVGNPVWCLDLDLKPAQGITPERSLAKLEEMFGEDVTTTLAAGTPSGGLRLFFQRADGIDRSNISGLLPGVAPAGRQVLCVAQRSPHPRNSTTSCRADSRASQAQGRGEPV